MTKRSVAAPAVIMLLMLGGAPRAQSKTARRHRRGAAATATPVQSKEPTLTQPQPAAEPEALPSPPSPEKRLIEGYLKRRLDALKDAHKARAEFFAKETEDWRNFWNKFRDDRNLFEVHVARQRLDMLESLGSVAPQARDSAVADFEKLQSNLLKSFEQQQQQRMQDFFAKHLAAWKEMSMQQEKDRADLAADADASWLQQKEILKNPAGAQTNPAQETPR